MYARFHSHFFSKMTMSTLFFQCSKNMPHLLPYERSRWGTSFLFWYLTNQSTLFSALSNHTCSADYIRERTRNNTQSSRFVTRVQHMNWLMTEEKLARLFSLGGTNHFSMTRVWIKTTIACWLETNRWTWEESQRIVGQAYSHAYNTPTSNKVVYRGFLAPRGWKDDLMRCSSLARILLLREHRGALTLREEVRIVAYPAWIPA